MIGNDLIYLPDWPRRCGERLERYRSRIFTEAEIRLIEAAEDPYKQEAKIWAGKEALYKLRQRAGGARLFRPKSLEILTSDERSLTGIDFHLFWYQWGAYLECRAVHRGLSIDELKASLRTGTASRGSFKSCGKTYRIYRGAKAPWLLCGASKYPLSISHDGALSSFCWLSR